MITIGLVRELGRLGVLVGHYPAMAILLGLLISAPGLAGFLKLVYLILNCLATTNQSFKTNFQFILFRLRLDIEMNGGFVPSSAPSHREIADQQSFFGQRGIPFYMALFGKTDGNLMDDNPYAEINSFYDKTMKMNLTANGTDYYQFQDLCHPLCSINEQLKKLMAILIQ